MFSINEAFGKIRMDHTYDILFVCEKDDVPTGYPISHIHCTLLTIFGSHNQLHIWENSTHPFSIIVSTANSNCLGFLLHFNVFWFMVISVSKTFLYVYGFKRLFDYGFIHILYVYTLVLNKLKCLNIFIIPSC